MRLVKARVDVQMIVNLICHVGSISYELFSVSLGRTTENERDLLVDLELIRNRTTWYKAFDQIILAHRGPMLAVVSRGDSQMVMREVGMVVILFYSIAS